MRTGIIIGLALLTYALTRLPAKYCPGGANRRNAWRKLIGLVAVIGAILIVMNPEFYALGILGDSAFFDFLVVVIGLQLQMIGTNLVNLVVKWLSTVLRFTTWRFYATCMILLLTLDSLVSAVQKIAHRISS